MDLVMNASHLLTLLSRLRARLWLAAVAIATALSAHAGPLGLEMGTPLKKLRAKVQLTPEGRNEYRARSLPGGHPDFAAYRLLISPVHGLCKVTAWTRPVRTGPRGLEIRHRFDQLREALTSRYGAGRRYDLLREGSLWGNRQDWMVALQRNERRLYAVWTDEMTELDGKVSQVKLRVDPVGTDKARLQLGFEFRNVNECVQGVKDKQARRL
jgi:hypothetical protein